MTVKNVRIEPQEINKKVAGKAAMNPAESNFSSFLGAVDAMAPTGAELMYQSTGSSNAAAVLHGAFSGMSSAASVYGYGAGGGTSALSSGGVGAYGDFPGVMGVGSYNTLGGYAAGGGYAPGAFKAGNELPMSGGGSAPGTQEMINSMNTNNLKLLELQAVMQSNMQAWNTKSNILSADHRARMAMIEKFTARG